MNDCEICLSPTRNRVRTNIAIAPATPVLGLVCNACRRYVAYWNGMTPEERAAEEQSIARHEEDMTWPAT